MALKIIHAAEPMPVANIVLTVYAPPGTGKSSLAFTAEKPLSFDADKGSYRAKNRKDTAPVERWEDLEMLTDEDLAPYSTVILDTGGRVLDKLRVKLIRENPKNAGGFGGMSGMGWNNMFSGFSGLVNKVIAAKKDLIIVCHMDEKQEGEVTKERIDVAGQSKNEIYKLSDAMCRIQIGPRGERVLDFNPREGGFGKNPAQLPHIPFPHTDKADDTLAKVIVQIKESINRLTAEQAEARKEQEEWTKAIAISGTIEDFNILLPLARQRKSLAVNSMIAAEAAKRGYKYEGDKKTGKYVAQLVEAVA
jgi:hypothetical protein